MASKRPPQTSPATGSSSGPSSGLSAGSRSTSPTRSGGVPVAPDPEVLVQIARMKMPFGRYAGTRLIDLPEPYLVWFRNKGYPRGRLGELMGTLYEIKANGLEALLASLREPTDPRYRARDPRLFREGEREGEGGDGEPDR